MPTRNVVLTDEQERMVRSLVRSGRYQNASEVIREGLRLVERREAEEAAKLEALRAAVAVGVADLERGAFREFATGGSLCAYLEEIAERALSDQQRD